MADLRRRQEVHKKSAYEQLRCISSLFAHFTQGPTFQLVQNWQLTPNDILVNTVKLIVFQRVTHIFLTQLTNVPLSLLKPFSRMKALSSSKLEIISHIEKKSKNKPTNCAVSFKYPYCKSGSSGPREGPAFGGKEKSGRSQTVVQFHQRRPQDPVILIMWPFKDL